MADKPNIAQAVVSTKGLTQSFKAFAQVGEVLEQINNLEQYQGEAQRRADDAGKVAADAEAKRDKAIETLATVESELSAKSKEAKEVLTRAQAAGQSVISNAEANGKEIVATADAHATETRSLIAEELAEHEATIAELETQAGLWRKKVDNLKAELTSLRERISP